MVGPKLPARCSQWIPFFEERVASGHGLVVAPVVGGLELPHDARELRKDHLADHAIREQQAKAHRQRLVVIVLADEQLAAGPVPRLEDRAVVPHPQIRRLLDEHVLAGRERLQGQIEMKAGRDGNDHRVHARILDRRRVVSVAGRTAVLPAKRLCPVPVTTCVAAHEVASQGPQTPAVYASDESAAQEGDAQGFGPSRLNMIPGSARGERTNDVY